MSMFNGYFYENTTQLKQNTQCYYIATKHLIEYIYIEQKQIILVEVISSLFGDHVTSS